MCMVKLSSLRLLFCVCLCAAIVPFAANAIEDISSAQALSLADLQRIVSEYGRVIRSFRLEGVVCALAPGQRLVALQDDSATVLLELPKVDAQLHAGDRLVIIGENSSLTRDDFSIQVGTAPVVDNDGHHSSLMKSGKVFLAAGFQPIHLAWFNNVSVAVLKLEWEGPGLRRQQIPSKVLWGEPPGLTNLSGLNHGLNYTACNGDGVFLADFENLKPVAQGVATNFSVSYRARPEHTALFFSGFIQIPRPGGYTFYLTSDDGSQLKVGTPSVSCARTSTNGPSASILQTLSQMRLESGASSWIELEGEVIFAGIKVNHLDIELAVDGNRVPVTVVGGATLLATNLLHEHIRVRGIREFSLEEKKITRILVPSSEQVEFLGSGIAGAQAFTTNGLLTSVAQVKQLTSEQTKRGIPARIRCVLIGTRPSALMVQDSTGGLSVHFSAVDWADQPRIGEVLEVEGVTGPGLFAPVIIARKIRRLGDGPMPEPIRPRWDQLMNGSMDCQYIEIQGILTAVSAQEINLYTADGTITVDLNGIGTDSFLSLLSRFPSNRTSPVGSLIRLRGCCMSSTDQRARHVVHRRIQVNCPVVEVEDPAPNDPFSLPTRKIADLLWFDPHASALQRTKLKGQIMCAVSGEYLVLEDQRGFRVLPSQPLTNLIAGDLVEAVGFPKLDGPSPVLQEAQILKTGHAQLAAPIPVSAQGLLDGSHDSTVVQVEATLIGEAIHLQGHVLEMQAGARHFLAIQKSSVDSTTSLAAGSRLQLVGIYVSAGGNRIESSTDPFSLFLIGGTGAIKVLARPSWWTTKHALMLATVLAGVLGMALVWIKLLRQTVELRTAELRKEIQERQRAEQDQAIEQERTRVAQDLHDELGAGLTAVGMLGELVKNPATPTEKKAGYLEQITHSAHSLVTALDEIVWAVNPQHDSIASSANYYAYFAQPFLNMAGIACRLEIAESFSEQQMDPRLRHGVFLAFKEALNNVVRHSGATEVTIKILTENNELIIAIADNGHGVDAAPNQSGPSRDGMAGMRDRLKHFGGNCSITNQTGSGTIVEFRIPFVPPCSARTPNTFLESSVDAMEDKQ